MTDRAERATTRTHSTPRPHQSADVPATRHRRVDTPAVQLTEPVRTKPVRRSVDLSPSYHARLTQWCADTADEIGVTRVTGQDVIRALVARLLADQTLARRIRADIRINT